MKEVAKATAAPSLNVAAAAAGDDDCGGDIGDVDVFRDCSSASFEILSSAAASFVTASPLILVVGLSIESGNSDVLRVSGSAERA